MPAPGYGIIGWYDGLLKAAQDHTARITEETLTKYMRRRLEGWPAVLISEKQIRTCGCRVSPAGHHLVWMWMWTDLGMDMIQLGDRNGAQF